MASVRGLLLVSLLVCAPSHSHGAIVHSAHPSVLDRAKARLAAGDVTLAPAVAALRAEADEALRVKPPSVMDKELVSASGDKHDYFSFAPYWWPNPARPDGRPYIRRDGERNPESRRGTDRIPVQTSGDAFETLALAYFFTGHEPYAEHAARLLRTWFLDEATRMNPHLRYAQAIPGITDGRGIGIIEGVNVLRFVEWLPLVFDSPAWTKADEKGFRQWIEAYHHWLCTSANGLDEADEVNNHGTWYDAQVAQLALYLGHESEAREKLERALAYRIATQIEPDGRQPHELARTKPIGYCLLNLRGLFRLATLGEAVGVDGWTQETKDGRSLAKALAFLAPYVDPKTRTDDIAELDRTAFFPLFVEAERHIDAPTYQDLLRRYAGADQAAARWQLFR
jgi:hypothetical protein